MLFGIQDTLSPTLFSFHALFSSSWPRFASQYCLSGHFERGKRSQKTKNKCKSLKKEMLNEENRRSKWMEEVEQRIEVSEQIPLLKGENSDG